MFLSSTMWFTKTNKVSPTRDVRDVEDVEEALRGATTSVVIEMLKTTAYLLYITLLFGTFGAVGLVYGFDSIISVSATIFACTHAVQLLYIFGVSLLSMTRTARSSYASIRDLCYYTQITYPCVVAITRICIFCISVYISDALYRHPSNELQYKIPVLSVCILDIR